MAIVAALLGSSLGLALAVFAWAFLDFGLLQALGLWSGCGILAMAGILAFGRSRPAHALQPIEA